MLERWAILAQDDAVVYVPFGLAGPVTATLHSLSYGGGVDGNGNPVAAGGFDTVLSLFDAAGVLIAFSDDGFPGEVGTDPLTGLAADGFMTLVLGPGVYTLAISETNNYPGSTVLDAYSRAGEGNFTAEGCGVGVFFDPACNARTGDYYVEITTESVLAVPLPGTPGLFLTGLATLGSLVRRRRLLVLLSMAAVSMNTHAGPADWRLNPPGPNGEILYEPGDQDPELWRIGYTAMDGTGNKMTASATVTVNP